MANKEQPAGTIEQGPFQAFDRGQIKVVGRFIHDDKMWNIGDTGGKKNFPNFSRAITGAKRGITRLKNCDVSAGYLFISAMGGDWKRTGC